MTRHRSAVAHAEEGVSTEMARTVAANRDLLNLINCDAVGQVFDGDDLRGCDRERRGSSMSTASRWGIIVNGLLGDAPEPHRKRHKKP